MAEHALRQAAQALADEPQQFLMPVPAKTDRLCETGRLRMKEPKGLLLRLGGPAGSK